ncbi:zinc ribbon domain-containing protein [Natronococcus sp. JC468]|uniref:zinc ribbon domain-containing protein n=1 Tax=Natronococcus sp. JC468 TaxID=1961921 RepID=UPI001439A199|nr:zinc ribbon domain-containing protein [Natronococcus sp. JC468]NKE36534.1 zinc ribbon domain-containing protein [Natronococcus sp. JC468]
MILRYYADADVREWHDHTLRLLGTLHDVHGIAVEIDRIDEQHGPLTEFPGEVRSLTPEEVYERDLKRNQNLNQTIDQTPSEAFKHYGKLDVAGNIAVVDDEGTVQWASTLPGYADGYRPGAASRTAMDFLEDIATSPSNRLCVDCLSLLDGDENFCPNCGCELP